MTARCAGLIARLIAPTVQRLDGVGWHAVTGLVLTGETELVGQFTHVALSW
jgi:hypothetical protein